MKKKKRAPILIATPRKRKKRRRKKSHLSRCVPFSACLYLRSSRSISTQTKMSTIRCSMTCRGKTQTKMTKRTKRKTMETSSRGKTSSRMTKKKRLMKDSKSTNNRCYNNSIKMRILITQSLTHMTCLCNEIWAQTQ
jgi:hypothetical protein